MLMKHKIINGQIKMYKRTNNIILLLTNTKSTLKYKCNKTYKNNIC